MGNIDNKMNWEEKPIEINTWDTDIIDNFIFIDERGTNTVKYVKSLIDNNEEYVRNNKNENNRYITLCACIVNKDETYCIREHMNSLKREIWAPAGKYIYKKKRKATQEIELIEKKVLFHFTEIKSKIGPFWLPNREYKKLNKGILRIFSDYKYTIISITIDKYKLLLNDNVFKDVDPYKTAYQFLFERIGFYLNEKRETGIIMNEGRSDGVNSQLHKFIVSLKKEGNYYLEKEAFRNIRGVYFNKKWNDKDNTYFGLEMVDLILPSLFNYTVYQKEDEVFRIIRNKIRGYPGIMGKGIKLYPK